VRHAARRDRLEPAVIATLDALQVPWRAVSCPALGDLEVIAGGRPWLIEVKSGNAPYSQAQRQRRQWLRDHGVDVELHCPTWRSVEDVFSWVSR
jgi:hypothetical protein